MDKIIAALTTLLEQWIDRVRGAATEHTLAGPISVEDLWIVALYLGFALLLNAAVALILRRRRKAAVALAKPNWHRRAYLALGKPLYFAVGLRRISSRHSDTAEADPGPFAARFARNFSTTYRRRSPTDSGCASVDVYAISVEINI
jgi:hypothetical protein